jgi:uncharacterized membrane protein (GlpM family)
MLAPTFAQSAIRSKSVMKNSDSE